MKHLRFITLLLALATLAVVGCGKDTAEKTKAADSAAQSGNKALGGAIDVCSKITVDDAAKIMKQTASFSPQGSGGNAMTNFCNWGPAAGGTPASFGVTVTRYQSADIAASALRSDEAGAAIFMGAEKAKEYASKIKIEKIDGLGEHALLKLGGMNGSARVMVARGSITYDFIVVGNVDTSELVSVVKRVLS
jgi:hypothetical protein